MLFMKLKKVGHSQPHWHPPHNKKFVQHICIHPMCWEPLLNKNIVQIRAKFARSSLKIPGLWSAGPVAHLQRIARSSREVRSMFRPQCNVQRLKSAVRRVTLLACSANGAPRALGLGGRGGLEGRVSGGLHQGVPRVTLLHSVMAVQGSLISRHH